MLLLIVCDRLERRFAHLHLGADFQNLRRLFFQACSEGFNSPAVATRCHLLDPSRRAQVQPMALRQKRDAVPDLAVRQRKEMVSLEVEGNGVIDQ